jgi:uncharacterized protein (DUF305 family)
MDRRRPVALFVVFASAASCRTMPADAPVPIVQPGAPGKPGRVISAREASDLSQLRYTEADVRFMQGMIGHHRQALEMTALLPTRTAHEGMRLLAQRIEISQADEIQMMLDWLKAHGEPLPDPHAHHAPGAVLMPGMLTAGEMQRLADATGAEFDRLFLEFEVLTKISGVSFDEALQGSKTFDLDGHPIPYIGKSALIANKKAAGRHKDLADVEELERLKVS